MKNSRFPALSFFSALLIGIGWALIVIGILVLAFCAISLFSSSDFAAVLTSAMTFGLVSLALVLTGLFTVTGGESIRVFLAIEENTRAWTTVVRRTE
jgi:tellurite resistance protein TehA-like permease